MDYRFSERRSSERFRSLRGLRIRDRSLGIVPTATTAVLRSSTAPVPVVCVDGTTVSDPVSCASHGGVRAASSSSSSPSIIYTGPVSFPPGAIPDAIRLLRDLEDPGQRAFVDSQMWGLDQEWAARGSFTSMKACVHRVETGGPILVDSWFDPRIERNGCRNVFGSPVQPTCEWGFWKIDRCDIDTASKYLFQYPRYLWAQHRMREHLSRRPQPGSDSRVAADWAFEACQLISVFLWSTNVRFDSPNSNVSYMDDFKRAGLLIDFPDPPPYDGPPTASPVRPISISADDVARRFRGGTASWLTVTPFILNNGNFGSVNAPGMSVLPRMKSDFSPLGGPADTTAYGRPYYATASAGGPVPWTATATPSPMQVPFGLTADQAREVMNAAISLGGALRPTTEGTVAWSPRWSIAKAWNDWWFRATWGWDTYWKPIGEGHYLRPGASGAEWSSKVTFVAPSARMTVDALASMLEHYSDPSLNIVKWIQQAVLTYSNDTSGISYSASPAAANFVDARNALLQSVAQANAQQQMITQAQAVSSPGGVAVGLIQSVVMMIASYIPVWGQIIVMLWALLQQLMSWLLANGWSAVGNTPCPPMPFMRVMMPSTGDCNLAVESITASILGISSNASWPVNVAGKSLTFFVDGKTFSARFDQTSGSADVIARRINSAAADVGLPPVAYVDPRGQVHVEGQDPGAGPARIVSGDAFVLGFPGTPRPSSSSSGSGGDGGGGSGGSGGGGGGGGGLLLALAAVAAGFYAWSSSKKNATMREP